MTDWKCKRCGMCCKGRGDLANYGEEISGDCSELSFDENGLAQCGVHDCKPTVCADYPFLGFWDDGMCEREQKEKGVWIEYVTVNGKIAKRDQKGKTTICFFGKIGPIQEV